MNIDVPLGTKKTILQRKKKQETKNREFKIPESPPPLSITEVDGVEIKVERLPIRYENIQDVMEDLPDFCVDILSKIHKS